ncbi:NrtA/SsuA/CpmA family ABC transporter substrate-binding protein [Dehalogenimonas sp. THU2]|uniref:ABC transporter substrate-binding protein n=1 Tax=Dehalogenimonas sp. THU2 TaxID=3151121 RepID=UPI003218CCC0
MASLASKEPNLRIMRHLIISFVLVPVIALVSCAGGRSPETLQPVRVGMESTAVNSLIYIARDKGFFETNGIELVLDDSYVSGSAAAAGMLRGEVDVATAAELAVVRAAFDGDDITTLGSIDMFTHMKLVVRKDHGIETAADLAGKKVGVPVGSSADFFLGRYLDLHGISRNQITTINVQAPDAVAAITGGNVDAIVTWQPNIIAMQDQLGDKASILQVQSGQSMYCALISTGAWVTANPKLVESFLKALVEAHDFLSRNPEQGKAMVQTILGYEDRFINNIWPEHRLTIRLDQSLVLAMEDQARWLIENGLTEAATIPNIRDYLYPDGLMAVKPDTVSLIR